jgi:hypothetical protein
VIMFDFLSLSETRSYFIRNVQQQRHTLLGATFAGGTGVDSLSGTRFFRFNG